MGAALCRPAAALVVAALGAVFSQPAFAVDWPDMPPPPRATVEWVAQESKVNGLPTRIQQFTSELSAGEVLAHYRSRWRTASVGKPREFDSGPWRALSSWDGKVQFVVQVQPSSPQGSRGLLSMVSFAEKPRDILPSDWPTWRGTRVKQVTESIDGPVSSRLVTLISDDGLDINVQRWTQVWLSRGFVFSQQQSTPRSGADQAWIGSFNREGESIDVVMKYQTADRRTYITVNVLRPVSGNGR